MYKDVCVKKGKEYYDYSKFQVNFGHQAEYEIVDKIGRGKFSEVY